MKLSLIASMAALAVIATAAHAQDATSSGVKNGTTPDGTIATTKATYAYSLHAGADSDTITPPAGVPVTIIANQTAYGVRGVAEVVLYHVSGQFLEWTGLESPAGSTITASYSASPGTHIVWLDFAHQVDIQVSGPNSFIIHNGGSARRSGKVTLIY